MLQPSRPSLLVARWHRGRQSRVSVALPMLSAHGPRWHHHRRAGARRELLGRPNLRCHGLESHATCRSAESPLRLLDSSPAAEAATPPGSKHRDAPAVKERERPLRPSCELEKICTQRVHGPPLADFAMRGKGNSAFLLWGCPQGARFNVRRGRAEEGENGRKGLPHTRD